MAEPKLEYENKARLKPKEDVEIEILKDKKPPKAVPVKVLTYDLTVGDNKYTIKVERPKEAEKKQGMIISDDVAYQKLLQLVGKGTVTAQGEEKPLTGDEKNKLITELGQLYRTNQFEEKVAYSKVR